MKFLALAEEGLESRFALLVVFATRLADALERLVRVFAAAFAGEIAEADDPAKPVVRIQHW